jgi:hypothetical protein
VERERLGFAGQFGESDGEFDAGSTHCNLAVAARKGIQPVDDDDDDDDE